LIKYSNLQILKSSNTQIFKSSNPQILNNPYRPPIETFQPTSIMCFPFLSDPSRLLRSRSSFVVRQGIRLRIFTCTGFIMLFISQCQSQFRPPQVDITEQDTIGYNFIQQQANEIENRSYLEPFFQKLYQQRIGGGQKINIIHIGDSHILGNFLTEEVRKRLQNAFGDAGRGMIFPYKLAGSNGPRDYLVENNSGVRWSGNNCQKDLRPVTNYGLSGCTLESNSATAKLTFRLRDTTTAESHSFTKVTIFQKRSALQYNLNVRDEVTNQEAQLLFDGDYSRSFYFDRPVGQVSITADKATSQQKLLTLDGISLENELSGVVYHSIGVNGAKYMDYARTKYFADQVGDLHPDLIILSMGTNEAQGHTDRNYLYRSIGLTVEALLRHSPNAFILLTTPADSYLRGKGFNPNMADVAVVIRRFARDKGYALWDLYTFSGGENSAANWKTKGLMTSDSVHYTRAGYATQGKLLYQGLVKAYNDYVLSRP